MIRPSSLFVLALAAVSSTAVPLNKRIAQTISASTAKWEAACLAAGGGQKCNPVSVTAFTTLLAAAGPCDQQKSGDAMINLAKELNNDPTMIKLTQVFVQQPRNTPSSQSVPYCQEAPANQELQGLFQCQFQGANANTFVGGVALGGPGTIPFQHSAPLSPLGSCPAHPQGPIADGTQLVDITQDPGLGNIQGGGGAATGGGAVGAAAPDPSPAPTTTATDPTETDPTATATDDPQATDTGAPCTTDPSDPTDPSQTDANTDSGPDPTDTNTDSGPTETAAPAATSAPAAKPTVAASTGGPAVAPPACAAKAKRGISMNWTIKKRIAQTDLGAVAQSWQDLCLASGGDIQTGDPCVKLAGLDGLNALLAGADPCAQQDNADLMVDFAKSAGIKNRDALIANAKAYRAHPRNALDIGGGLIPSTPFCTRGPRNQELVGIHNGQLNGVNPGLFGGPKFPVIAFGEPGTCPFEQDPNVDTCTCS